MYRSPIQSAILCEHYGIESEYCQITEICSTEQDADSYVRTVAASTTAMTTAAVAARPRVTSEEIQDALYHEQDAEESQLDQFLPSVNHLHPTARAGPGPSSSASRVAHAADARGADAQRMRIRRLLHPIVCEDADDKCLLLEERQLAHSTSACRRDSHYTIHQSSESAGVHSERDSDSDGNSENTDGAMSLDLQGECDIDDEGSFNTAASDPDDLILPSPSVEIIDLCSSSDSELDDVDDRAVNSYTKRKRAARASADTSTAAPKSIPSIINGAEAVRQPTPSTLDAASAVLLGKRSRFRSSSSGTLDSSDADDSSSSDEQSLHSMDDADSDVEERVSQPSVSEEEIIFKPKAYLSRSMNMSHASSSSRPSSSSSFSAPFTTAGRFAGRARVPVGAFATTPLSPTHRRAVQPVSLASPLRRSTMPLPAGVAPERRSAAPARKGTKSTKRQRKVYDTSDDELWSDSTKRAKEAELNRVERLQDRTNFQNTGGKSHFLDKIIFFYTYYHVYRYIKSYHCISSGFALNSKRPEGEPAVTIVEAFDNALKAHQVCIYFRFIPIAPQC